MSEQSDAELERLADAWRDPIPAAKPVIAHMVEMLERENEANKRRLLASGEIIEQLRAEREAARAEAARLRAELERRIAQWSAGTDLVLPPLVPQETQEAQQHE